MRRFFTVRKTWVLLFVTTLIFLATFLGVWFMNSTEFEKLFSPIYYQSSLQSEIGKSIQQAVRTGAEGELLNLADYTRFDWDKVCIFGMGASYDYINQVIGFEWLTDTGYVQEQRQLFLFVKDAKVVQHLLFRPEIVLGGTQYKLGVCFSYSDAIFVINGYDISNTRIHFLVLP